MLYLKIILCGGKCAGIPRVGKGVIWKYPPHKGIVFGKDIYLGPYCFIDIHPGAKLTLGNNVGITLGAVFTANSAILIRDNVLIGEYVSIRDSNHGIYKNNIIKSQPLETKGEININDDVWLGRNTLVLGNINIQKGIVVGANTFVNKSLDEAYGIYWGTPAILRSKRENKE